MTGVTSVFFKLVFEAKLEDSIISQHLASEDFDRVSAVDCRVPAHRRVLVNSQSVVPCAYVAANPFFQLGRRLFLLFHATASQFVFASMTASVIKDNGAVQ
jgi:hypothetical protein